MYLGTNLSSRIDTQHAVIIIYLLFTVILAYGNGVGKALPPCHKPNGDEVSRQMCDGTQSEYQIQTSRELIGR